MLAGHGLFVLFILLISKLMSSEEYSYYRYWFNSSALLCQLVLLGLDVSVIKRARIINGGYVFDRETLLIMFIAIVVAMVFPIVFLFHLGKYMVLLVLFTVTWAMSNFIMSYLRVLCPSSVAFFYSTVVLRCARIVAILPIVFLDFNIKTAMQLLQK